MIQTDKDWVWVKCPHCSAELPFQTGSAPAIAHMVECMRTAQLEAHPEVNEPDDPEVNESHHSTK